MSAPMLPPALSVYMDDTLIGTLHNTEPLSFSYDRAWMAKPGATSLHPSIPLVAGPITSVNVHAFFENLLPEGDQRRIVSLRSHVSSVFGMLATIGGDTAGSVVLVPQGEEPQAPIYQRLTWKQVNALVHADGDLATERDAVEAAAAGMPTPRLSVSGAQFKLLLSLDEHGSPLRPMGTTPSTYILKPDMVRPDIKIFASAVNETIIMRAAALCGLRVANVSYQPVVRACLVERYDRVRRADGTLQRIWQADFCQMLGKPSDVKYEHDGGPSFKDCYELLGMSVAPAADRLSLLRWLFFNLYVGNNDSHAKNLAFLITPGGIRLAPFYDLMSTRVYPGLGPHFAFSIGGEFEPGKIETRHLQTLAGSLRVAPKYLIDTARSMADGVERAVPAAAAEIYPLLGHAEKVMGERLVDMIGSIVRKMKKRIV